MSKDSQTPTMDLSQLGTAEIDANLITTTTYKEANTEINQLAQRILESATTKEEHELYSEHEGYEYEISRDNENESWYIQVRAADGGHLYDGWWKDSEDETLEAAIREAIDGAQILEDE